MSRNVPYRLEQSPQPAIPDSNGTTILGGMYGLDLMCLLGRAKEVRLRNKWVTSQKSVVTVESGCHGDARFSAQAI